MKTVLKIIGAIFALFIVAVIVLVIIAVNIDDEPKEEVKKVSVVDSDFTENDLLKAVKSKDKDVSKVTIDNDLVTITYKKNMTVWDESDLFLQSSKKSAELYKNLFKRNDVSKVKVIFPMTFTDQKGNETSEDAITITLNKENSNEIDYKNFISLLATHPAYMFNNANEYYIYPSIYKSIKSEYVSELENGFSKVE